MIPNPYVILGGLVGWLASLALCGWLMYNRGHDDMRNSYTEQQLTQANRNLVDAGKNNKIADDAGQKHETEVKIIHDKGQDIIHSIIVPPDADPLVPVWFVRLFDRFASRDVTADAYPGKSDSEPSDVRMSEVRIVLRGWADSYYTCKKQVDDTRELNPVLPPPPQEKKSLIDQLNPF